MGRSLSSASAVVADLRGGGRGWVLLAVASGWLFVLGTRFVLPALLPQVKAAFGLGNALAGLLVTLLWGAYAVTQFPAGVLIDRVGERRTLAASAAASAVGALALALAPTFAIFVAGLVLFGFGSGLYAPPRVTVLSRVFPDSDGTALGVTFAVGNVGSALLPLAAGVVAVWVGWRVGFGAVAVPLAVAGVALWAVVPVRADASHTTTEVSRRAVGRVLRAVLARRMVVTWVAMTCVLFAYQGVSAFLPTYLIAAKGLSQGTASVLYALFYVSGAATQSLAGTAADVYESRRVLAGLAGFGVLTLAALTVVHGTAALAVLVCLLGTRLGIGPVGNGYVATALPDDVQGTGYGLFRTFYLAVGATGSVFVGVLADTGLFDEAFLALAGVTAVSAALFWVLPTPGEAV